MKFIESEIQMAQKQTHKVVYIGFLSIIDSIVKLFLSELLVCCMKKMSVKNFFRQKLSLLKSLN